MFLENQQLKPSQNLQVPNLRFRMVQVASGMQETCHKI